MLGWIFLVGFLFGTLAGLVLAVGIILWSLRDSKPTGL